PVSTLAPVRKPDLVAVQLSAHMGHEVGAVEAVLVVDQPHEAVQHHANTPGKSLGVKRRRTACCRIIESTPSRAVTTPLETDTLSMGRRYSRSITSGFARSVIFITADTGTPGCHCSSSSVMPVPTFAISSTARAGCPGTSSGSWKPNGTPTYSTP